jgi:hypothetical protein
LKEFRSDEKYQEFWKAIDSRSYGNALLFLIQSNEKSALRMANTLLDFKDSLSMNIERSILEKQLVAIMPTNLDMFDLIINRFADQYDGLKDLQVKLIALSKVD